MLGVKEGKEIVYEEDGLIINGEQVTPIADSE